MRTFLPVWVLWTVLSVLPAMTARGAETVQSQYPGLASGVLTCAPLGELPAGVLLQCGELKMTKDDLTRATKDAPDSLQDQLKKNAFFVLEREATDRLLLLAARKNPGDADAKTGKKSDRELVQEYLARLVKDVTVADKEIGQFYTANARLFGGAKLDEVKDNIRSYLLDQKEQALIDNHLRTLGTELNVVVDAKWTKQQAALALDNPVDKARAGGKPALVAFSGASCCGPDQILPLLETVREKWPKALAVVYVEAKQEPILAARYNVRSIPTLILYNQAGGEGARWDGAVELEELDKALTKAGVK